MKYCLIGERLGHSFSADIHGKRGLDYSLVQLKTDELCEIFLRDYDGFNITIPYKKAVIPFLYAVEKRAQKIGAVNTVVRKDGKYYGYNTDIEGIEYTFSRLGVSVSGKTVMILGSGGASATARVFAEEKGAKDIITVSRSGKVDYSNCYDFKNTDIIINATPVGTFPDIYQSPVDIKRFGSLSAVFDLTYNPLRTRLMLDAKEMGVKCSDGLPMLVKQALAAEKIWGYPIENDAAEKTINLIFAEKSNVVLYGMPSSGKSTVGKLLAKKLNKAFVDTDAEILKASGKSPSEIILSDGEKVFRDIETGVIKELAKRSGQVIATGGGAVLKKENTDALKMNGTGVYIKRDISRLCVNGRPLSKEKGVEKLFEERKGFYQNAADISADNNGKVSGCVDEIVNKLREIGL